MHTSPLPECKLTAMPPVHSTHRNRAQCRRALEDFSGSIADFSRALMLDPSDIVSFTQRGHSFRRLGEYEAAIKDYTCALQLSPDNIKLYNNRCGRVWG